MANVILFTDLPPRNMFTKEDPWYIEYSTPPTGAYALASHLREQGYTVLVVPHCIRLSLAGVKQIIDNNSHDLLWVGLSTTLLMAKFDHLVEYRTKWATDTELLIDSSILYHFSREFINQRTQLVWSAPEINLISEYLRDQHQVPLLIGGGWINSIVDQSFELLNNNVHVVTGRSEQVVSEISRVLKENSKNSFPTVISNQKYDDVDFKKRVYVYKDYDYIDSDDWLTLEVSRGCAFNCSYCSFDRKSSFDSYRSPESLREELIRNYEQYGVTKYILTDDLYNDSKEKVRILYDQVWSRLPFKAEWTSYMRLDMFWADPDSAEFIMNSGARLGSFGIETLHNKAGSKVGKGLGKERILETLTRLKEVWQNEVLIFAYFITGLPEEPEESILETTQWLAETDLLFSHFSNALWVTPPDHKRFVKALNNISNNNDKFGIQWVDETNWINTQGITFARATELSNAINNNPNRNVISFPDYPELRKMGFTHQDIVDIRRNPKMPHVRERIGIIQNKITQKLEKFLQTSI
jgi:hypothetical protein